MPPVVAAAGIAAGGSLAGAALSGRGASKAAETQAASADKSAQIQAEAAKRAAEIQAQTAREALEFQKAEAAKKAAQEAAAQKANYDQWVAQQQRLGTLGQMLGLGPRPIPPYVPMPQAGAPATPPARPMPGQPPPIPATSNQLRRFGTLAEMTGQPNFPMPYDR